MTKRMLKNLKPKCKLSMDIYQGLTKMIKYHPETPKTNKLEEYFKTNNVKFNLSVQHELDSLKKSELSLQSCKTKINRLYMSIVPMTGLVYLYTDDVTTIFWIGVCYISYYIILKFFFYEKDTDLDVYYVKLIEKYTK